MFYTKKKSFVWAGSIILIGILIWGLFGWNGFEKAGSFQSKQSSEKNHCKTVGTNLKKAVPNYILIYLISENGEKSDLAAKLLRKNGFSECVSLVGGLNEWKRRNCKISLLISGNR